MEWEYFLDESYYGMYTVRNKKDKQFGRTISFITEKEAKFVCDELNRIEATIKV